MAPKKHVFSKLEKKVFMDVLKSHATIIENKNTDGTTLREKNVAWDNITREYNSSPHVIAEVSNKQLRRLWMNMKQRQREAITKERQHRMATGGGPSTCSAVIDPDISQIAPGLMVEISGAIDSDLQESANISMDMDTQSELSLDSNQQECTSIQISCLPDLSSISYPSTATPPRIVTLPPPHTVTSPPPPCPIITPPHPRIDTTPSPRIITTPPARIITTPPPCIISTPPPLPIITPHPRYTTPPSQPPQNTSFQRNKITIIEKEYRDRLNRAIELHDLEKELMSYKIREARAKAELAELILQQRRSQGGSNE